MTLRCETGGGRSGHRRCDRGDGARRLQAPRGDRNRDAGLARERRQGDRGRAHLRVAPVSVHRAASPRNRSVVPFRRWHERLRSPWHRPRTDLRWGSSPRSKPPGSWVAAHSTSTTKIRFRRSPAAHPRGRSFSPATRAPECGRRSRGRTKPPTARPTRWTDGAGGSSRVSPTPWAGRRTFRSVAHRGCPSSGGRNAAAPCTPPPSDRSCIRTSASGTRTGARLRSASVSISRPATSARARASAAPSARARRPVPYAHSLRTRYDVDACVAHIESPAGARCIGEGCLARHACPVGRGAVYGRRRRAAFHMRAFVRARRPRTDGRLIASVVG